MQTNVRQGCGPCWVGLSLLPTEAQVVGREAARPSRSPVPWQSPGFWVGVALTRASLRKHQSLHQREGNPATEELYPVLSLETVWGLLGHYIVCKRFQEHFQDRQAEPRKGAGVQGIEGCEVGGGDGRWGELRGRELGCKAALRSRRVGLLHSQEALPSPHQGIIYLSPCP